MKEKNGSNLGTEMKSQEADKDSIQEMYYFNLEYTLTELEFKTAYYTSDFNENPYKVDPEEFKEDIESILYQPKKGLLVHAETKNSSKIHSALMYGMFDGNREIEEKEFSKHDFLIYQKLPFNQIFFCLDLSQPGLINLAANQYGFIPKWSRKAKELFFDNNNEKLIEKSSRKVIDYQKLQHCPNELQQIIGIR